MLCKNNRIIFLVNVINFISTFVEFFPFSIQLFFLISLYFSLCKFYKNIPSLLLSSSLEYFFYCNIRSIGFDFFFFIS